MAKRVKIIVLVKIDIIVIGFLKKCKHKIRGGNVVDKRIYKQCLIYNEFDDVEMNYWFDFKQSKFLHNIDTFYYSVKFANDFTHDSKDKAVLHFRKYFEFEYKRLEERNKFAECVDVFFPGFDMPLNLKPFSFAGFFTICLECPDYFDMFFAPKVPHGPDGGDAVTCECVVQIRSYMLWMYGIEEAYERSLKYVRTIADHFGLNMAFTQENRIDYCWHSNYLSNPEKFFSLDNFHRMRVDRFRDALFHTAKDGMDGYEIDYIAMGKRSDKVFIRIYLKSKEVIEKGYKPWFFKVWLFNGLINRYDLYVYEHAFLKHSWKQVDMGRVKFYHEHGRDKGCVEKCARLLSGEDTMAPDALRRFADSLTPKVNLVMNVEYQTMRKHTKTYELVPFFDNRDKQISKRIYDYLDNRKIICDYLTSKVFRLAEAHVPGKNDSNKSRRDNCSFWERLRICRVDCFYIPSVERELVRTYARNLSSQVVKSRAVKAMVTYGIYAKGINDDDPKQDFIDALCMLNDNDLEDALRFKNKKVRQFNQNELAGVKNNIDCSSRNNIVLIDNETGEIYGYDIPEVGK